MLQSAAGFSDMDSPTSAYEKTQPIEACKLFIDGFMNVENRVDIDCVPCSRRQCGQAEGSFREPGQGLKRGEQEESRREEQQEGPREERTTGTRTQTAGDPHFKKNNNTKTTKSCEDFLASSLQYCLLYRSKRAERTNFILQMFQKCLQSVTHHRRSTGIHQKNHKNR